MNILMQDVKKKFLHGNNSIQVLDGISLEIRTGEMVALLGKSGSGKTTLLSLLAGLEKPGQGKILFGQTDISLLSEDALCDWRAKHLGIVFQQFHLIAHLTALENVLLPLEINGKNDKAVALNWLAKVGLAGREHHYPAMLSGGEQQRVAIARSLAFTPDCLLADEPTGNLDVETGKQVIEILFNMVKTNGTTMILVTHDEELAQKADRIVRLVGGKCHF
jgi:putative ABC transport system ATP-binding protein